MKGRGGAETAAERPKRDVPRIDGRAIVFSPAFRDRAGVKLAPVARAELTPLIKVVGTATFDPEHVAAVGTRIRGIVSKVMKVEGDPVKKGDAIAEIESAELGQAQADIAVAQAHRRAAELNATREEDLASKRLSTAREAEVARATLEEQKALLSAAQQRAAALGGATAGGFGTYVLRAPLDGSLVERHVAPGQSVENNVVAFRVANLDQLWVELAVFERDIGAVRKDDVVVISPLSDPERKIQGRVEHVGEVIDLNSRSADVRVEVDNKARGLRPGQSVSAAIRASGPARVGLSVPQSAVTYVDGKATVFVAESDTRVLPTEVELGATDGKAQEVVGGLREGQSVVAEGVFALKSELFR
jgi:cobalt-zinc-cadmium efflux system membrane fusion protein